MKKKADREKKVKEKFIKDMNCQLICSDGSGKPVKEHISPCVYFQQNSEESWEKPFYKLLTECFSMDFTKQKYHTWPYKEAAIKEFIKNLLFQQRQEVINSLEVEQGLTVDGNNYMVLIRLDGKCVYRTAKHIDELDELKIEQEL